MPSRRCHSFGGHYSTSQCYDDWHRKKAPRNSNMTGSRGPHTCIDDYSISTPSYPPHNIIVAPTRAHDFLEVREATWTFSLLRDVLGLPSDHGAAAVRLEINASCMRLLYQGCMRVWRGGYWMVGFRSQIVALRTCQRWANCHCIL